MKGKGFAMKRDTGHQDCHCRPIREGDRMVVPEHCVRDVECVVAWDEDLGTWLLVASDDGRVVSGMGMAGGCEIMNYRK